MKKPKTLNKVSQPTAPPLRVKLAAQLSQLLDQGELIPRNIGEVERSLAQIYICQETLHVAKSRLEEAWLGAQRPRGALPSDDTMRDKGEGDHIIVGSGDFVVTAKVSKPRETFDRELFIQRVAAKFKISERLLTVMADNSKSEGKASLTKRVMER